ncbi:hypothetical protein [Streptomyces albipurpureus]|uniref:Uncharacterized protein n=1 Tax=Streptomyces albipurpureus TaxID=2897419 RepID=A0ABT0ULB8_9ACTN|nr:hypothetical protein [Streptomyces sp. CWNU-1]MCM2388193.1 hypothetical protein [Streptomyces sp. CWNU-1]
MPPTVLLPIAYPAELIPYVTAGTDGGLAAHKPARDAGLTFAGNQRRGRQQEGD